MNEKMSLTIIIPAYNEEKTIGGTLKEVSEYFNKRELTHEVIVIDDGSSDKTLASAREASSLFKNFKVMENIVNKGKGYSVRKGVLSAQGDYVVFMDADNSTSIYEFDKFMPFFKEGYDVVIASRRLKESIVEEPQPLLRAKMGEFYIFLSKIILNLNLSDFNCGFKAYNVRSTRFMFELQRMNDWSFDVELLFLANKYGLKTRESPVRWTHKSGSKVKPVIDAIKSFLSLLQIKINDLWGKYKRTDLRA